MKKTTCLPFLLVAVMWPTTVAKAQEFATSITTTVASAYDYEAADSLQRYREISALPLSNRSSLFRGFSAREKSSVRRIQLALQLVKHPELNERQKQIILDAILISDSQFFAAIDGTPAEKAKANEALQSLVRRAHTTFSKAEATELFSNIGGGQAEGDIMAKYDHISALPPARRKAFFRNTSSQNKSDLWRTHLALFLVRRPTLNEDQKATILAAMSFAAPSWFELIANDPGWRARVGDLLRSFEERILEVFSLEDGAKIFASLGDSTALTKRSPVNTSSVLLTSINYTWAIDSSPYKQWTASESATQDFELERNPCQCSTESDWCPVGGYCHNSNCASTQSGCGTLWSYPCNGGSCQQ